MDLTILLWKPYLRWPLL